MLHTPLMIHASTTNQDPQSQIQLTTAIYYQNVDDETDVRWNSHWRGRRRAKSMTVRTSDWPCATHLAR